MNYANTETRGGVGESKIRRITQQNNQFKVDHMEYGKLEDYYYYYYYLWRRIVMVVDGSVR